MTNQTTGRIELARAWKQLRSASDNLSRLASENGVRKYREAGRVAAQLANAMEYGATFVVSGVAAEFDAANKIK